MWVRTTTNLSLDGVMQGLGGPEEDRRGGFERGGWALPLVDDDGGKHLADLYGSASAFLLGRRTYEIFAPYWSAQPDTNPIAAALNGKPKYVASTTLVDPEWVGTTVVAGDLAGEIVRLKELHDGDLLVPGSGVLVRWLLERGLVDELDIAILPVVVGQGTRLFPESGPDLALELVESRATPGGTTIQTYRPRGRPDYAE